MTATVFTEAMHAAAFIASEADHYYSRDEITIAQSQTILAGQVLGKVGVVAGISASRAAGAGNTGNGVMTLDVTAPVRSDALDGVYQAICIAVATDGGEFEVFDPEGVSVGRVAVGATFSGPIKFVIADGSTDFAAGDKILVTVVREDGADDQYAILNPTGTDGSQVAVAIAIYPVVTGSGVTAKIAGLRRQAQVRGVDIAWPSGITADQKAEAINQLARKGIVVR